MQVKQYIIPSKKHNLSLVPDTTKPAYYLAESKTTNQPSWAKVNVTQQAQSGGGPQSADHSHTRSSRDSSPIFGLGSLWFSLTLQQGETHKP